MTEAGPGSVYTAVAGLRTHYLEAGDGFPLILLHGTALDSATLSFGPSISALARRYRVIAPDWPGYGESEAAEIPLTTSALAAFLQDFLDVLGLERCFLLGYSMGGAAALGFALDHPQRAHKLVLVSSYGLDSRLQVPLLPYLALKAPLLDRPLRSALRRRPALLGLVMKRFVFGAGAVGPELLQEVHAQLETPTSLRTSLGWLGSELGAVRLATSYGERLSRLHVPALLLHGARDRIIPPSRARRAARRIPSARLEIVARCGHWLPREAPEAFVRSVLDFLDEAGSRP